MDNRRMMRAVALSLLWPGSGHVYLGRRGMGAVLAVAAAGWAGTLVALSGVFPWWLLFACWGGYTGAVTLDCSEDRERRLAERARSRARERKLLVDED